MAKRKGQTDKQRATKHTHKTIDRVTDCHEGVQGPITLTNLLHRVIGRYTPP
jgi:hypothetical protein